MKLNLNNPPWFESNIDLPNHNSREVRIKLNMLPRAVIIIIHIMAMITIKLAAAWQCSSLSFPPSSSRNGYCSNFYYNPLKNGIRGLTLNRGTGIAAVGGGVLGEEMRTLYSHATLLSSGTLVVSDLHTITYYEYGNPKGKPALYVHGGPGAGSSPDGARFFDPNHYRIISMDQRGCGCSKPFGELDDNTTFHLVSDFEKLRLHFGNIESWLIFGGSWGSTLALTYAIMHPERVSELVLRGIFLMRRSELDFFYEGKGTNHLFPLAWDRFISEIPSNELETSNGSYIEAYGRRLRGEFGVEKMKSAAKNWAIYEESTIRLQPPSNNVILSMIDNNDNTLAFARIENHYFTGGIGTVDNVASSGSGDGISHTISNIGTPGFFPREGWLLEDKNLCKISHIPTVIVQGQYDVVCPATSAYELHAKLPHNSKLYLTIAGHNAFEVENVDKLVEATDRFKDEYRMKKLLGGRNKWKRFSA